MTRFDLPKRRRSAGCMLLVLAIFSVSHSVQASDCSPERLETVRQLSQQLSTEVEKPALEVIRDCSRQRDQALLWLAAFYRLRGDYDKAAGLSALVPGGEPKSNRDRVFLQATRGNPEELRGRIERDEPGFSGDPEALLVLSRSLARNRSFKRARTYYAEYLALKPDDQDVAIEEASTFLWEGRMQDASRRFQELEGQAILTPAQRLLIREGLLRAESEDGEFTIPLPLEPPALDVTTEMASSTFYAFSRTSMGANYRWKEWNALGRFHWLSSQQSGVTSYSGSEGALSYSDTLGPGSFRAALGAFSANRTVPTAEFSMNWRMNGGVVPYIGFYQDALARNVPLPGDLSDRTRNGAYFGLKLSSTLDYRLEFRSFGGWTSGTRHAVRIHLPLGEFAPSNTLNGNLSFRVTGENDRFTVGTPYLYSPKMETAIRGAVVYGGELAKDLSGTAQFEYGQIFESPQTGSGLSFGSSADLFAAAFDLGYSLGKQMLANFRFRFDRIQGGDGATNYGATTLALGLSFGFGAPQELDTGAP